MIESHQVFVVWGESVDKDSSVFEYKFSTQAEVDAFLLGVGESNGWFDAAIFKTKEEAASYIKEECCD
jgi:hypothetical protein